MTKTLLRWPIWFQFLFNAHWGGFSFCTTVTWRRHVAPCRFIGRFNSWASKWKPLKQNVSGNNILFANDDELAQMGPLTDDDLDIWKGLPVGQRDSVQGNSPAMGTDSQKFRIKGGQEGQYWLFLDIGRHGVTTCDAFYRFETVNESCTCS